MFYKNKSVFLLLLICLAIRLPFSIFYIEDIDSLRFALSAIDYNVLEQRPHFPGYPLYCFFLKILYTTTGSIGFSFSFLGGISIFLIALFSKKIIELYSKTDTFELLTMILFIPLFCLMGNRYMPDIMGLSVLLISVFFFLEFINKNNKKYLFLCFFFIGLEVGIRVSYIPFFIPFILTLITHPKDFFQSVIFFFIGLFIWLIPFVIDIGYKELIETAINNTNGHFNDWGGGVMSDDGSYYLRFTKMIESIWADGIGGYWKNRHWLTIMLSFGWIAFLITGIYYFFKNRFLKIKKGSSILLLCLFTYLIWIYFFQNIIYKPRHILPFLPFVILLSYYGMIKIKTHKSPIFYSIFSKSFLIILLIVSSIISFQHLKPTAISKLKSHALKKTSNNQTVIYSNPLINYYLSKHKGFETSSFVSTKQKKLELMSYYEKNYMILSSVNLEEELGIKNKEHFVFHHNPYVNRLWHTLNLYIYQKP